MRWFVPIAPRAQRGSFNLPEPENSEREILRNPQNSYCLSPADIHFIIPEFRPFSALREIHEYTPWSFNDIAVRCMRARALSSAM